MDIKSIKKMAGKYKIVFSDGSSIITYDDVILNNNILYKKSLDDDLVDKINSENKFYEAYNSALKFLRIKLRSEVEVRNYLKKLSVSDIDSIINRLKDSKMINDVLYAKAYIHDRFSFSNDGPNKIRKDLLLNNISDDVISEELSSIDFSEKLEKMILKKINSNSKYSDRILKQKLLNHFISLGYEKSDILYIIDNNLVDNDVINSEYNKLLRKYSGKYSSSELEFLIRKKLYQKGFDVDEINGVMK